MAEIVTVNWTGSEAQQVYKTADKEQISEETIINTIEKHISSHESLLKEYKVFNNEFANSDFSSVCLRLEQNITQMKKIIYSLTDT
jgi:hypothetical protein